MSNTPDIFFSMHEIDGVIEVNNFKSKINIFITPFSITHFGFGYICQALGINYFYGLVLHTIYEYINYTNYKIKNKWRRQWIGFRKDSVLNGVGDTLFFMIGMFVSKNYNNIYLFIFIFLMVFIFYSPYFQNYLTNMRLKYLKSKGSKLQIKNTIFDTNKYGFHYYWLIICLVVFIKLKISNKSFKF
jgi:hypothetical protein